MKDTNLVQYDLGNNTVIATVLTKFENGDVRTDMDGIRLSSEISPVGEEILNDAYRVLAENNSTRAAEQYIRSNFDTSKTNAQKLVGKAINKHES